MYWETLEAIQLPFSLFKKLAKVPQHHVTSQNETSITLRMVRDSWGVSHFCGSVRGAGRA